MRNFALAAGFGLSLALASSNVMAAAFQFDSNGQFSNPTNAQLANAGDRVYWPDTNGNSSYMDAVDFDNHTGNPGTHILIGSIDWYNASQNDAANTVTFTYTLSLHFDLPLPGGTNSDSTTLTVVNTRNNAHVCFLVVFCNDNGAVDDTASGVAIDPFNVNGYRISNVAFAVTSGGSILNGIWSNPEGNTSTLSIYADIAAVATPEPASMALLGTGLVGIGLARRRARHG